MELTFNVIRNERLNNISMNLQLRPQLYNIPGIKDDLQEQEIHPKANQQTGNSLKYIYNIHGIIVYRNYLQMNTQMNN